MTQKAAVYVKKHEWPVVQERPIPTPKDDQLLLKVVSVGLNPLDWKIMEYGVRIDPPAVMGFDIAGDVVETGPAVSNYKKGDRVVAFARNSNTPQVPLDTGGLQQYTLVGSAPNLTVKLPDNISYDDAATLPIAFNTVRAAFYDPDQSFGFPFPFEGGESYGKGKAVLVVGGSSQVGLAALEFLRLSGFSRIITTAAKKHEALVKKFGATHLIDRSQPEETQIQQIKSIAPDLEYILDSISYKETVAFAAQCFGEKGGQIRGTLPIDVSSYSNVSGHVIASNPYLHQAEAAKFWPHVAEYLAKGEIHALPYRVAGGLEKTSEALEGVKKASGYKVMVHPNE